MKRTIFFTLLVIGASVLFVGSLAAVELEDESEFYPVTYPIHKIYKYKEAYKIDFIRDDYTLGIFWVRYEWITGKDRIGDIAYGQPRDGYPAVTVYFRNGEFDHLRLYLVLNGTDSSWGRVSETDAEAASDMPSADAQFEMPF